MLSGCARVSVWPFCKLRISVEPASAMRPQKVFEPEKLARAPCPPTPAPAKVRDSRLVVMPPLRSIVPPAATVVPPATPPRPAALLTSNWPPDATETVPVKTFAPARVAT